MSSYPPTVTPQIRQAAILTLKANKPNIQEVLSSRAHDKCTPSSEHSLRYY